MEKITFWQLINKHNIEIPIIQRDYAQGRSDSKSTEIRHNFISDLLTHLQTPKCIDLDFVYGKVKDKTFIPLDGQQRLTTLFLLHWYILNRIEKQDLLKDLSFSYKTRASSRAFTSMLISLDLKLCDIDQEYFIKYVEDKKLKNNNKTDVTQLELEQYQLSYSIVNSNPFFLAWQQDPTVQSILTMLDSIHIKFKDEDLNKMWNLLSNETIVTFNFLNLDEFELTDELYLKMNARGRSLNEFELFKAKLQNHIEPWEENYNDSFSLKIDTVWSDLFWKHKGSNFFTIDYEAINYIAGISMINIALENDFINQEQRIQELFNFPITIKPTDFINKSYLDFLKSTLDLYSNSKGYDTLDINSEFPLWNHCDIGSSLFIEFAKDKNKGTHLKYNGPTYKQRVLFYAQTQFLIKHDLIDSEFYSWMRFVRNIVENTPIDNADSFIKAIKAIHSLCEFNSNILENLKEGKCDTIPFFGTHIKQEKLKATLLLNDPGAWKKTIQEADNHLFFKAEIDFLFKVEEQPNISLFTKWLQVAKEIFNDNGLTSLYKEKEIFLRVLISKFNSIELLKEIYYDSTKDNLKAILKSFKLRRLVQEILDQDNFNDLIQLLNKDSIIESDDQAIDINTLKLAHEDLYKTEFLSTITSGSYFRQEHYNFVLYPYNAKADWKKYIIGSERNAKISKAFDQHLIESKYDQRLYTNKTVALPYFWGWNIFFNYKNKEYIWHYKNGVIISSANHENNLQELEELKNIFSTI